MYLEKTRLVSVCFHSPLFLFCVLDYIVLGSDSGRIVILEYHPSKNMFEKIHQETFGKSGCRRIVPGQFLAVDPKGRAVMIGMNYNVSTPIQDLLICQLCSFTSVIKGLNNNQANLFNVECNNFCELFFLSLSLGAIEKQKLVYILNRDAAARLTISSPLEAHKANTLVYHVVGVDVGFENPMFACLEMDYEVRSSITLACVIDNAFGLSCTILDPVCTLCFKVLSPF